MAGATEKVCINSALYNESILNTTTLLSKFPVVPDGYGLSYSIGDDHIRWTITSLNKKAEVLKHYLAEAASEVKHMLEAAKKKDESASGRGEETAKL